MCFVIFKGDLQKRIFEIKLCYYYYYYFSVCATCLLLVVVCKSLRALFDSGSLFPLMHDGFSFFNPLYMFVYLHSMEVAYASHLINLTFIPLVIDLKWFSNVILFCY